MLSTFRRALAWMKSRRRLCAAHLMCGIAVLCVIVSAAPPAHAQQDRDGSALREARQLFLEGRHASAASLLTRRGDALDADGWYLLGRAQQELLRYDEALHALHRADTTRGAVLAALARSYDRLGRRPKAVTYYRKAYASDSLNRQVGVRLASLYGQTNRWDQVRDIYRRLVDADSLNAFLLARLGAAYQALDSLESAAVYLERAHRIDPASVRTALRLSGMYMGIEYFEAATNVVDRSLEAAPESPLLWQRRGLVAFNKENYDVAAGSFQKAISLGDSAAVNFRNLGISHYWLGAIDSAGVALERALASDSSHAMATFYLGTVRQHQKRFGEALTLFDQAKKLMRPGVLASVYTHEGTIYKQQERFSDAIASYRLAMQMDPAAVEVYFHLANTYDAYYSDPSTALDYYERYLRRADSLEEGTPVYRTMALQRIKTLRERAFFD